MNKKSKEQKVWEKGKPIRGKNPDALRQDVYGNKIKRSAHGKTSPDGWEKDHKTPKSKGGSDSVSNLQPLQWEKNRQLGDKTKKSSKGKSKGK